MTWGFCHGKPCKPTMPSDRITKIIIRCGEIIDSVSYSYTYNGETFTDGPWGGEGGFISREVLIEDGDELIGISGSCGSFDGYDVICSLAFETARGVQHGPFGTSKKDRTFSFSDKEDSIISFWVWANNNFVGGISVQTLYDAQVLGGSSGDSDEGRPKIKRVTALESVNFALRKLEEMQSCEPASLSGATALSGVSGGVQSIQMILGQIHGVLMNANVNWENADSNVQELTMEVEDVSRCTEQAIFSFLNEVRSGIPVPLPSVFERTNSTEPVNFFALHKLSGEIRKIKLRAEKINIKDLEEHCERVMTLPTTRLSHPPNIDETLLLGLQVHQDSIIKKLLDRSLRTTSVVVVGNKGSSRTVLVEKIYQSAEVKDHFTVCVWLTSQVYLFKPFDILRKILLKLGVTDLSENYGNISDLISKLRDSIKGKSCIVVINNYSRELCSLLNDAFVDGSSNSRVLTTTESEDSIDACQYMLPSLNCQESLKLLRKLGTNKILQFEDYPPGFRGADSLPRTVFEQGHPLFDPHFCYKTLLNWAGENQLFHIVYHIYSGLPSYLKTCFAYLAAVFPYGSVVPADSLIRLWVVEGYIPQEDGRTVEGIADSCIDQLAERGILRVTMAYYHNQSNQLVRSIILHPTLHHKFNSSARKKANSKNNSMAWEKDILPVKVMLAKDAFNSSNILGSTNDDPTSFHRLALHLFYQFNQFSSFDEGPKVQESECQNLHSLFFFGSVAPLACPQFCLLRVLAVFWANIRFPDEDVPSWLDSLHNLRYLGFIVCLVKGKSLVKSLGHLTKLETLDLSNSIVSGISEYVENTRVTVMCPVGEEVMKFWSPIPDMDQCIGLNS